MTLHHQIKNTYPLLLLCAYAVFLSSYFLLDDYNSHYRQFALLVFLPGLAVIPTELRSLWGQSLFRLLLVYMAYLLLSGLWSEPLDWYRLGQKCTIALYLLGFIAVTRYLLRVSEARFQRALLACVAVAATAALVSMVVFYRDNPFPQARLDGLGTLTNVNEFTVLYGVYGLLALGMSLRARRAPAQWLLATPLALFIAFAWFGQSRMTLVALVATLMLMLYLQRPRQRWLYTGALLALLALLAMAFPDIITQSLERGSGRRPLIWAAVWQELLAAPLFGHGLVTPLSITALGRSFANAHSAYLQVLWQGGLVGLGLFLALLAAALRQAFADSRRRADATVLCVLVFAALTMLTDQATLIDRTRDQWMLFWFPIALLLSYQSLAADRGPEPRGTAST